MAREQRQRDAGQQESAVEDESALVDAHDLQEMGAVIGPIGENVGEARADDAAGHQPEAEIGRETGWPDFAPPEPDPGQDGAEEAQRGENAVAVDFLAEDAEQNGMHRLGT